MDATGLDHYGRMVDRVDGLVHSGADLTVRTPACPEWTAWETVCHVAANVIDGAKGVVPEVIPPTTEWTGRQVADHRDRPVDDVLTDWRTSAGAMRAVLNDTKVPLLLDAVTHEHDVRGALGRPGAQDDPVVPLLLDQLVSWWPGALGDLPPIELDDGSTARRTAGDASPGLVLQGSTFDFLRMFTARRSQAQVRATVVDGDFDRYADHLILFTWPTEDQP